MDGERIGVPVAEAAAMIGICKARLYPLVMCGEIASYRVGRRRLVLIEDLRRWAREQAGVAS